jgi:hypothetical protein
LWKPDSKKKNEQTPPERYWLWVSCHIDYFGDLPFSAKGRPPPRLNMVFITAHLFLSDSIRNRSHWQKKARKWNPHWDIRIFPFLGNGSSVSGATGRQFCK